MEKLLILLWLVVHLHVPSICFHGASQAGRLDNRGSIFGFLLPSRKDRL